MKLYVISYDISENKIRKKISKLLEGYGKRVQYSVFECRLKDSSFAALYQALLDLVIDSDMDSIRIYRICSSCETKILTIGMKVNSLELITNDVVII